MPASTELLIYSVIGRDWWTGEGTTATDVANWLGDLDDDVEEVSVRINSPGGLAFEGTAIYNVLKASDRSVVVHIDGLAASAASVVAMAGDRILMADNALMMIHGASGFTYGTAEDHEAQVDVLKKLNGTMAKTYANRTGQERDLITKWMDAETWMDADEAKDRGFATDVEAGKEATASWGRAGDQIVSSFRHAPHQFHTPLQRQHQIAASADGGNCMSPEQLKAICIRLNLPDDANPETIASAIDALNEKNEALEEQEPDPRVYASREDLDATRASLEETQEQLRDSELEEILREGEGRIVFSDNDRERYRNFVKQGSMTIPALREELAARPKSVLTQKDDTTEVATGGIDADGLTARERDLCSKWGLSPKSWSARVANNKERSKRIAQELGG